jgi:abequosyltransferase
MTNSPRLSICIPTYNFGEFIGDTLESIISQATDEVEIVVVDGASTDNTPEIVQRYQKHFPRLHYHRLKERGGIDRDMARSVELAQGEYCWLFSSDDIMKEGALGAVLEEVKSGLDLYLCGLTLCTRDMKPIADHRVSKIKHSAEFDLGDRQQRLTYFQLADTTTAFFSFMGSLIVRKSKWDAVPLDERFVGSLWAHVARIFRLIPDGLRMKYIAQSYLYKRSDNDSFMDKGIVHRYRIAIEGYHRLANTFFGEESVEAFHVRRTLANEFGPQQFLKAKNNIQAGGTDASEVLQRLVLLTYSDRSLRNSVYLFLYRTAPLWVYVIIRSIYRTTSSLLQAAGFRHDK